jgi:hypothetical protein
MKNQKTQPKKLPQYPNNQKATTKQQTSITNNPFLVGQAGIHVI